MRNWTRPLAVGFVALALAIPANALRAQAPSPDTHLAFEVASIKANTSADTERGGGFQPGGRFHGINMNVRMLIGLAYGGATPSSLQIIGGPAWIDATGFNIEAAPATTASPEQRALMMRTLLADRFGLILHTEQRDAPIYALVIARNDHKLGPRLSPAKKSCVNGATAPLPLDPKQRYCGALLFDGAGHFSGVAATMPQLARVLSRNLDRPVVDQTGLEGTYDLDIDYVPKRIADAAATPSDGVSIYTAFQEQLGLKLQPATRPVDVLVIDHIERPTED